MLVEVRLRDRAEPIAITTVRSTHQDGGLYCVTLTDGLTVRKFPLCNIEEITEHAEPNMQAGRP